MPTRMRLLKGATVLLYVGPLFAGMIGLGWGMVAPFVAIFVLWLVILRPGQWPRTAREWLSASAWAAAATQVLSQLLLVAVLLAIGRGIGAVAGFLPAINPIFPLAVSFLAIPLCRLLWDAEGAAKQGVFLDADAAETHATRALAAAGSAVVPLLNLGDGCPDGSAAEAVARVMTPDDAFLRLKALVAALARPNRSHLALRRALVLWASDPEVVTGGRLPEAMADAFALAGGRPDLLRLYLPRAQSLIAAFPALAPGFPSAADLRALARSQDNDLRAALQALASSVEAPAPPADAA